VISKFYIIIIIIIIIIISHVSAIWLAAIIFTRCSSASYLADGDLLTNSINSYSFFCIVTYVNVSCLLPNDTYHVKNGDICHKVFISTETSVRLFL